ncbi:MAG TPA: hypothetical protein VE961_17615 [Pyrinomonadaceae bacterium]|nr:hypothetical protein [Pyrinomonadaceae bacterium]
MRTFIQSQTKRTVIRPATVFLIPLLLVACSRSSEQQKSAEMKPIAITTSPSPPLSALNPSAPAINQPAQTSDAAPQPAEVSEALARIFGESAGLDQTHSPAFLIGDFNGDGSPDLAIVTKANDEKLAEINNELANWTLEDPHDIPVPGTPAADRLDKPKSTRAEKNDVMLAIIHGVGPQGWRNPQARQAFLLRHAAGTGVTVQSARNRKNEDSTSHLPLRGDAISEVLSGQRGVIFWTGAKYAWAPQP